MQPLRIRVDRILDFGRVVTLVGFDTESALAVSVHIDHRQLAPDCAEWPGAGLPEPIEYAADRLILHLDMLPADGADQVRLVASDSVAGPHTEPTPIRELDR